MKKMKKHIAWKRCIKIFFLLSDYYFFIFSVTVVVTNFFFFFSSRRRHTRFSRDWSSDVYSSDLFLCIPSPVHDQLVNVDARRGFLVGVQDLAVPVGAEGTPRGGAARQLEVVELVAGTLEDRLGNELRQHIVNLERDLRPVTIGKQIPA